MVEGKCEWEEMRVKQVDCAKERSDDNGNGRDGYLKKDRSNKCVRNEAEQRKAVLEAPIVDEEPDWQAQGFTPTFWAPLSLGNQGPAHLCGG